jgi:Fe-S-cluster containining protein
VNVIKNINYIQITHEILKFYKCPRECKSQCCIKYEITFSEEDIKQVSFLRKGSEKTFERTTFRDDIASYNGLLPKHGGYVFEERPCPFLNGETSKCKIHQFKPTNCKIYPFNFTEIDNEFGYKIDMCRSGFNISVDLFLFERLMIPKTCQTTNEHDRAFLDMFKKAVETFKNSDIHDGYIAMPRNNINVFLAYLKTTTEHDRLKIREQFIEFLKTQNQTN